MPHTSQDFETFKSKTSNVGILEWEFEALSTSVNFLDLTISIENNKIVKKNVPKTNKSVPVHHDTVMPPTRYGKRHYYKFTQKLLPLKHKNF